MGMSLTKKKIKGHTYYYARECKRVDGRPRVVWQKYLGRLEDIVKALDAGGTAPAYAEVFEHGLSTAMWNECSVAQVVSEVDAVCPKRKQSLSVGEYIAVAAINRAIAAVSKMSMWEWFTGTSLLRHFPAASSDSLSSPRFWDHMDQISSQAAQQIWGSIITRALKREHVDISSVSYDGTNFYTFIDTFNMRCTVAKRGKNKQGHSDLRQVAYALFCTADGHIPLMYDVYEGNRNDAKQFPEMLARFARFMEEVTGQDGASPDTTIIFDKGNNSKANFALVDAHGLKFVGAVKLDQVKDLVGISNKDPRFRPCDTPALDDTKAFRVSKDLYGGQRTLVVTYSQNLFNAQWLTVHSDIAAAMKQLDALSEKMARRASGIAQGGTPPTVESVTRECAAIRHRQHMKEAIRVKVTDINGVPHVDYQVDIGALERLSDNYLGKNILVTNRDEWSDDKIISGYRGQYVIEDVFKEMKDRRGGSWWPMFHWTDSKIQVHGLYCTIALLLRALAYRRVRKAGVKLSMKRMLSELGDVREVVNVYESVRKGQSTKRQTVLTKMTELQQRLVEILCADRQQSPVRATGTAA